MSNLNVHNELDIQFYNSIITNDNDYTNKIINIYIAKLVLVGGFNGYNKIYSKDGLIDNITITDFHNKLVDQIINNKFGDYKDSLLDGIVLNKILNTLLSDFSNILYDFECKSNTIYFSILDYYCDECDSQYDNYSNLIYKFYADLYIDNLISFFDLHKLNKVGGILEMERLYLNNSMYDLL
ncbi:MAG: hypothetical protein V3575_00080 [Candidatus Absconditabacteria bacterium]